MRGTSFRPEALRWVEQQPCPTQGPSRPAIVVRQPDNPQDQDAIRVLVYGAHIGFIGRAENRLWQPVLRDAERRGLYLAGKVSLLPDTGLGIGARLKLRDSIPGFVEPLHRDGVLDQAAAAALISELEKLTRQAPVRNKRGSGYVAKRARAAAVRVRQHALAIERSRATEAGTLQDLVDQLEVDVEELLEAADADEREDLHAAVQAICADLAEALEGWGE